jgi:hypothetical protein
MTSRVPGTIAEMMQSYAQQAVDEASQLLIKLDYSEASLQEFERLLERVSARFANDGSGPSEKELDAKSRVWGAYFGETIRRLWQGEWGVETYPGTVAPVISVDIGGAKIFPVMKVHRRLTRGDEDNTWEFYRMIKDKLSRRSQDEQ